MRARRLPSLRVRPAPRAGGGPPRAPRRASSPTSRARTASSGATWPACAVDIFFKPSARRQLLAEVNAQFERFAATGLKLDHVNTHKHFHLHPTIAGAILKVGARSTACAPAAPRWSPAPILQSRRRRPHTPPPALRHRALGAAGPGALPPRRCGGRRQRIRPCLVRPHDPRPGARDREATCPPASPNSTPTPARPAAGKARRRATTTPANSRPWSTRR